MAEQVEMSAKQALEWAFAREYATLDLSKGGIRGRGYGSGGLACDRIDTSRGRSFPHPDADTMAEIVVKLPRHWAVLLYSCARIGRSPDWMPGAVTRIEPMDWKRSNQHKPKARTEILRTYYEHWFVAHPKNPARRVRRSKKIEEAWCPVTWEPHPHKIAAARHEYLKWWVALDKVREKMQAVTFQKIVITPAMPPVRPWASSPADTRQRAT